MKGNSPKRLRAQIPDELLARQRMAGTVRAGIQQILDDMQQNTSEAVWIPNVLFGGSFSIMIGKAAPGTIVDRFTRPTMNHQILGAVLSGHEVTWKSDVVQRPLQTSGDDILAIGSVAKQ